MNEIIKRKARKWAKVITPLYLVALLPLISCSDFDDYNEVKPEATEAGKLTLWENIQKNSQLSNFASLIKQAGFDEELNSKSYYTVWAPLDGSYDASAFSQLDNNSLLKQFVYNHVAAYSHHATGNMTTQPENVLMLNDKTYSMAGASPYTFDEVTIQEANLPNSNGLLHILNGVATYYPNMYEYLMDNTLSGSNSLDSLRAYFKHYETTYLDEEASVVGPIVNGVQTYVDSVMVTENALTDMLNAAFEVEDSSYTFLMPTNAAWIEAYERIKPYYNYIPTTVAQGFVSEGTSVNIGADVTINIDPAYWQDSIVKRFITNSLVYSNKDAYNQWVEGASTAYGSDTLRSTTRGKFSNPNEILANANDKVKMSNGFVRIADKLVFHPWESYAPERVVSAANSTNQARILTGREQTLSYVSPDPEIEDFNYIWVEPTGPYAKPELDLYLNNVLSTTYNIYCVFMPNEVDALPNRVIFELNYCDADGKLQNHQFLDEDEAHLAEFTELAGTFSQSLPDNATNATTYRAFSNDPTKVDTLFIGQFTFPVSYAGLSTENICPNIKISSPFTVFNRDVMAHFTRDLRIAAIILRPVELDEFEESNKQ